MSDTFDESIATVRSFDIPTTQPSPSRAPRVWAGAILLLAGLGLIILAGCFLIGASILVADPLLAGGGAPADALFIVLLLSALSCLVGAGILFVFGARGLLRIMNE